MLQLELINRIAITVIQFLKNFYLN